MNIKFNITASVVDEKTFAQYIADNDLKHIPVKTSVPDKFLSQDVYKYLFGLMSGIENRKVGKLTIKQLLEASAKFPEEYSDFRIGQVEELYQRVADVVAHNWLGDLDAETRQLFIEQPSMFKGTVAPLRAFINSTADIIARSIIGVLQRHPSLNEYGLDASENDVGEKHTEKQQSILSTTPSSDLTPEEIVIQEESDKRTDEEREKDFNDIVENKFTILKLEFDMLQNDDKESAIKAVTRMQPSIEEYEGYDPALTSEENLNKAEKERRPKHIITYKQESSGESARIKRMWEWSKDLISSIWEKKDGAIIHRAETVKALGQFTEYLRKYGREKFGLKDAVSFPRKTSQDGKTFIALDGDDIGDLVVEYVYKDDIEEAKAVSERIKKSNTDIIEMIDGLAGEIIFDGGDNILATLPIIDEAKLKQIGEDIIKIYKDNTAHTATIGIADNQIDAQKSLVLGKNSGKAKVVFWDEKYEPYWEEVLAYLDKNRDNELQLNLEAAFYRESLNEEKEYADGIKKHYNERMSVKAGWVQNKKPTATPLPSSSFPSLKHGDFITIGTGEYLVVYENKPPSVENHYHGFITAHTASSRGLGEPTTYSYSDMQMKGVEIYKDFIVDEHDKAKNYSEESNDIKVNDVVIGKNARKGNFGHVAEISKNGENIQYKVSWFYPDDPTLKLDVDLDGPVDKSITLSDPAYKTKMVTWVPASDVRLGQSAWVESIENKAKTGTAGVSAKWVEEQQAAYNAIVNNPSGVAKADNVVKLMYEVGKRLDDNSDQRTSAEYRAAYELWHKMKSYVSGSTKKKERLLIEDAVKDYGWMFQVNANVKKYAYDNDIDFITDAEVIAEAEKQKSVMELEAYLEETVKTIEAMTLEEIVDFVEKLPTGGN